MRRTARLTGLVVLTVIVTALVGAPRAAASTSFTWSGADQEGLWSLADNWSGGVNPSASGSIGTLSFLDLGSACDSGTSSGACYESEDDLGTAAVQQLQIADNEPYLLLSDDVLTLDGDSDGVGIEASPAESESAGGVPDVEAPITLGATQTWQIEGDSGSSDGLEVDDVSEAADYNLYLQFGGGDFYTTSLETGTVFADGEGYIVLEKNPNAPNDQPLLAGTVLSEGAGLEVTAPNGDSGSISAGLGYRDDVSIGAGTAPDGTLDVTGNVTLGSLATLDMFLDEPASTGSTTDPSLDYSQLSVSGTIYLGQADLNLDLGADSGGNCRDLVPGQVYTLISAGTIDGEIDDGGAPITNGEMIQLQNDCNGVNSTPTVTITYDTSSTPETVTAAVVSGGHAGDLPSLTGDFPTISETSPVVGLPLQATTGDWSENPTSYDYDWYSCSASAGPDCENSVGGDAPSYTPTVDDGGNTIEVCVSATNTWGTSAYEYCSDPTDAVSLPPAPTNTGSAPSVEGPDQVGDTLTANPGSWSGSPTFSYQWQLCGTQGQSCTYIPGATGTSYSLTGNDVGQYLRVEVTATNIGGSTVAHSNLYGQVLGPPVQAAPASPTTSSAQIRSALRAIAHPSGKKTIAALVKTGLFKTGFDAPTSGSLSVIWRTTVTSGTGKHKKRKTVTVASGSANPKSAGTITVTLHLTSVGKSLLSKKASGLVTIASERFKPSGQAWDSVTKKFRL